jgi:hypothetical protein
MRIFQGEEFDDGVEDTDEEPDVDDIEVNAEVIDRLRNLKILHLLHFYIQDIENGVQDNISAVLEFLDEETCMDMLR